jgi:hypothetical protein
LARCDFSPIAAVLEPTAGFVMDDTLVVAAEVLVLHEQPVFTRDPDPPSSSVSVNSTEHVRPTCCSLLLYHLPSPTLTLPLT